MPDEEKQEGESTQAGKKGFPKIIIFIVAGMLVVGVGAFVAVRFIFAPAAQEETKETGEAEEEKDTFYGELFSFEQAIIVNLAETSGQRYLKVNLQLEMNDVALKKELEARTPQLMDMIITILSSKTIDDVTTTIGRNRLKREMLDKINAELVTGRVVNIYFTEFVIQ